MQHSVWSLFVRARTRTQNAVFFFLRLCKWSSRSSRSKAANTRVVWYISWKLLPVFFSSLCFWFIFIGLLLLRACFSMLLSNQQRAHKHTLKQHYSRAFVIFVGFNASSPAPFSIPLRFAADLFDRHDVFFAIIIAVVVDAILYGFILIVNRNKVQLSNHSHTMHIRNILVLF